MGKTQEKDKKSPKTTFKRIIKDSETGLKVLEGPSFTKDDVHRDFPDKNDRDSHIIRKSVGL